MALIVSDTRRPSAAAVFTQNRVVAAPVVIARGESARVARAGAGTAGQCGKRELRDEDRRASGAGLRAGSGAELIGAKPEEVLPASTGVIGVELDARLIVNAMPRTGGGVWTRRDSRMRRAAIMTTDTCVKTAFACR